MSRTVNPRGRCGSRSPMTTGPRLTSSTSRARPPKWSTQHVLGRSTGCWTTARRVRAPHSSSAARAMFQRLPIGQGVRATPGGAMSDKHFESDRITDVWGVRTPYGSGEAWPVRVDQLLAVGLDPSDVDQ